MAGIYEDTDLGEYDHVRLAVGDCIHSWCSLEHSVTELLSWVLDTPYQKASIIFCSVQSFATKIDFINELFEGELAGRDELKFWETMFDNLRTLASARNVLAHHSPITRTDLDRTDYTKWKTVIAPNTYDQRQRMNKRRGFTLVDIQMLAADIKRTDDHLLDFLYHLDETAPNPRRFCQPGDKLKLYNEMEKHPAPPKTRKWAKKRAKRKPSPMLSMTDPEKLAEQLAKYYAKEEET